MIFDIFRSKSSSSGEKGESSSSSEDMKPLGEAGERKAFERYAQESNLPPSSEWPSESPLIVVPSIRAKDVKFDIGESNCTTDSSSSTTLPLDGRVVHFSGPLFEGKMVSRVRDVPSRRQQNEHDECNMISNETYFNSRSRQYQWSIQGRFKKRIRFDQVVTGQEFDRPFRNKPSSKLVERGLYLLKNKLPETFECELFCNEPRFDHPLLAGCQHFRIDHQQDLVGLPDNQLYGIGDDGNVIEDTSTILQGVPQDGVARRKFFSSNTNLEQFYFEPDDLVYTFDFFANFFSPVRHRLELTPFFSIDLIPYFNGYPLYLSMAKIKCDESEDTQYLWATEMWHKRLLNYDERPSKMAKWLTSSTVDDTNRVDKTVAETEVDEDAD